LKRLRIGVPSRVLIAAVAILSCLFVFGGSAIAFSGDDTPTLRPGATPKEGDEAAEARLRELDISSTDNRTAGDNPLDVSHAGELRRLAARAARKLARHAPGDGPHTFAGEWSSLGPNPIVTTARSDGAFYALSGRIGALAIRPSNGEFILGGAQGGIWTMDAGSGTWVPRTSDQETQTIGALTIAPSNDKIVYAGTGEGALSGDSMFGAGILKSTDGGITWTSISGDYFVGVAVSRIAVDPTDPNHLYASVLRGRGGARRVTPPVHSRFGIWESTDGGVNWKLLREVPEANGATDIEIDPLNRNVLYASFWADGIYKSTDGGRHWTKSMKGLPTGDFVGADTRFSVAISHPSAAHPAVLYTGFDWDNPDGSHHIAEVFKSTDGGANWSQTGTGTNDTDNVEDYCGTQCFYDNVIEVDPNNPNIVYAGGSFGYDLSPQSGGIFRSTDGGASWENLGWDLHPDFHALAIDPADPAQVLIGNDGGVWYSPDRGGRPSAAQPLSAAEWQDLNGTVNPSTAAVIHRTGLDLTQYTSIATVPTVAPGADSERFWGGTQDNGTQRKSANSKSWFDVAGGDGGQVLVDPSPGSPNNDCPLGACFVYGTYFGISNSLYRFNDGGNFFTNQFIQNGINLTDRSDFYVPWVLSPNDPNQLFVGSYRLYRTDDARDTATWNVISPDLTSGCTGTAPNGARTCAVSAIGVGGGTAAYVGTLDGLVWVSPDAQTESTPTWVQINTKKNRLPNRPVATFAVDRSNYRIAYVGYNSYDEATPKQPGHVFKTSDGGQSWTNISGDMPDAPVNSLTLDPAYPNTLYAATDVGPFVTYNGGAHWAPLGTGMPTVAVWQIDLDTLHRVMAAGTHGRGAYRIGDTTAPAPALVLSKVDSGVPVGPASNLSYTITLKNIGNGPATGITLTDPIPDHTSFVSADNGGTSSNGTVTWSGLSLAPGASIDLHLSVGIADALKKKVTSITNDGLKATSAEGPFTTGSPVVTPIAPQYSVSVAPSTQTDGAHSGSSVTYTIGVTNLGFTSDSYSLSSSGGTYSVSFLDSTCTSTISVTPTVAPGDTTNVCVEVAVPTTANDGDINTATVTATSVGKPTVSASATVKTIAVTKDTLLVDEDGNAPDVQSYYSTALTTAGVSFSTWDLATDKTLPKGYLLAHKNVFWFTGNSYPGPIGPYESELKAFLDGGGNLFLSGQDLLDQAAGTTPFVHDYLHVTWDGSETQNDKSTAFVTGVTGNTVSDGIGQITLDHSVLGDAFMDEITPNGTATAAFTDDGVAAGTPQPDALTFADTYKVVFLAFPMEEYGAAADKADLVTRVMTFFGS
jgi:uncharacterized repeat protein (TIGR01451 family)